MLQVALESPTHTTATFGEVTSLDAVATRDPETGAVAVFAVNRSTDTTLELAVPVGTLGDLQLVEALTYSNDDHTWSATAEDSTAVLPAANETAALSDGS